MAETSQTIYQTTLPPWAEKQYGELLNQGAKQIYNTNSSGLVTGVKPYTPYGGDRIADFTTDQLKVQSGVAGLTAPGQFAIANTGLAGVAGLAGTAAPTGLSQAFGYAPGAITADTVTTDTFSAPGTAASYMSPYQQNVTDIQINEARRQADIAKSGAAMESIGRGTFGGARQALMQSQADRNLATQLGAIQATGSQNAYQQAQQAFQADQQRALQAQQANQGAGLQAQQYTQQGQQFGAGLGKDIGLAGLTMGLEGAKTSGQLGATEQIATLERLKAQSLSAAEQQAMQQQINDLNYQEFLNAQNYPREMLDWQAGILKGVPTPTSQTQTQTQPSPSLASQLLGAGLGALGAYRAFS